MAQGSAQSREMDARPSHSYFEWKPAGHPVTVYIRQDVIDRIEADVRTGLHPGARGIEHGGVLFGRSSVTDDEIVVYVEDFETVDSEHRRGASFVLSDGDRRRLERILRKGTATRQVAGFFRSHTRPGLYLDQDDDALFQSYFPGCSQVFLLIRAEPGNASAAGFFFWEDGTLHRQAPYLEFPFRPSGIAPVAVPEPAPTPPAWMHWVAQLRQALEPLRHATWKPVTIAAAIVLCFLAAEYQLVRFVMRSAPEAIPSSDAPSLHVERGGGYLRVDWNREANSVRNAKRAVLVINDGPQQRRLELDAAQLRSGSIAYAPSSGDVSFRLEVEGASSEVLRVVDGTGPSTVPPPVETKPAAAQPEPPPAKPARARRQAFYDDGL